MADGVFLLRRQLGKGLAQLRHEKHRVIAEAVVPLGCIGNGAEAISGGVQPVPIGKAADDGGVEMGGAGPSTPEILQQQAIAGLVTVHAAVSGGIDARCAIQRVHAQAGVVGNGGQAAGLHDGHGLDGGVFGEGDAVFLRLQVQAHVGLEDHLHPQLT